MRGLWPELLRLVYRHVPIRRAGSRSLWWFKILRFSTQHLLKRNTRAALDGRLAQSRGAHGMAIDKKPKLVMPLAGIEERIISMQRPSTVDLACPQGRLEVQAMAGGKSNRSWL